MLDTNERYFSNSILCTFVEPHPHRFASLLKSSDQSRIEVIPRRVQDVEPGFFSVLGPNDILFVDSSHVMKTASDVNYLLFEILPHLASGVYVHFHDIAYPLEYPSSWATEGRAWNEAYALRAFLQYNSAFKVVCFVSYLLQFHDAVLKQLIPVDENSGCSIWLKRI